MFKAFAFTAAFALFVASASAQTIPVGGLCAGFAGPVPGTCVYGSRCCVVGPDRSLCAAVATCPDHFIAEGGTCSGIAGPSPYPCVPGTTCCNLGPDHSVCQTSC